jgi:hypothetical protein
VSEPYLGPPTLRAAGDQALLFQGVDRNGIRQPGELSLLERLTQSEQLQHGPLRGGQVTQSQRHQLDQAGRRPKIAPKPPQAALLDQRTSLQRPSHQLAQKQRIAATTIDELTHRRCVHRAAQHRDQQLLDCRSIKHTHLDAISQRVLPQRHHRIRGPLTGPDGGQHRRRPSERQLVEQGRRPVVQQMGVIHEHQQRTPSGPVEHGPAVASQQVAAVLAGEAITVRVGRQHRCQRPERQTPRRPSSRRASH